LVDTRPDRVANLSPSLLDLSLRGLPRGGAELGKRFAFLDSPVHERTAGSACKDAPGNGPALVLIVAVQSSNAFVRLAYREVVGDDADTLQRSHLIQDMLMLVRQCVAAEIDMAVMSGACDRFWVR